MCLTRQHLSSLWIRVYEPNPNIEFLRSLVVTLLQEDYRTAEYLLLLRLASQEVKHKFVLPDEKDFSISDIREICRYRNGNLRFKFAVSIDTTGYRCRYTYTHSAARASITCKEEC